MKTNNNIKSTFLAVAFFGVMTIAAVSVAHAQNDTVNPLFSTTGPNVLGHGHLQWNSSIDYNHLTISINNDNYPNANLNGFGINTGLRFGIGDRAEMTLDVNGAYNTFDTTYYNNTTGITPSVGAKLLLYEGKGWLPKVAFFTRVALPVHQNAFNGNWTGTVQPEIGFQFRNVLWKSLYIDYSLGCSWNNVSSAYNDPKSLLQYSFYARKLVNDRHTFGIGIDNLNSAHRMGGGIEERWLVTDNLQLTARLGVSGGIGKGGGGFAGEINALVGVNWMIR